MDGIRRILEIAQTERRKLSKTREVCGLITIDIKNAFNWASWKHIMEQLKRRNIYDGLKRLIGSSLTESKIIDGGGNVYDSRRSLPGLCTWPTVLYDGVLRKPAIHLIAYAEDLAVVVVRKEKKSLMRTINKTIQKMSDWLKNHKLELAPIKRRRSFSSARRG